ncbi:unnamed protein product [Hermetia illucens]|uniref:Lipase domain-containing protein n=1 Tax=Hermetia illucens TaxID=343691 RepID=A0A7R8UEJ6_HERIL|nr:lipase member H-B-like [Hermetia illucens]CAD7079340.1 unnamed protein product [Hermetia illucens]
MKASLAVLALGLVAAVLAAPAEYDPTEWTVIPDENYNMHLVNMKDVEFELELAQRADFAVKFYLYTKSNPKTSQELVTGDEESVKRSHFNKDHPTRILSHGWRGDQNAPMNPMVRDKYLDRGDYNIIIVDWGAGAGSINYIKAAGNTVTAGKKVAALIDFLAEKAGLNTDNTYLIGHSLGGHVVGLAGKYTTRGKINTIFGLDAALPLFSINDPSKRLAKGDGRYVESIHTDGGILGFLDPLGDASFYPHWGKDQPGCGIDIVSACSHSRSYIYFAESLDNKDDFVSVKCPDFTDVKDEKCSLKGAEARMGGQPSNYGRGVEGVYYLPVNSKAPYATGRV